MDEARVVLRKYDPETDQPFIYSSWRNGLFYHVKDRDRRDPRKFFSQASHRIAAVLKQATVRIACLSDCPMVIVGYSICTGTHLEWIYVKEDYRRKGVGRMLCNPKGLETTTNEVTKIGAVLLQKYGLKTFKREEKED